MSIDHPLRAQLANELHARPFLKLTAPVSLEHYAIFSEDNTDIHEALVRSLCSDAGIDSPAEGATHFVSTMPCGRQLKWERHTEFSTFTFVVPRHHTDYFAPDAFAPLPASWLAQWTGVRFVAIRMELLTGASIRDTKHDVRRWLDGQVLVGSKVLGGGKVFCDWNVREDGFMRFLVIDEDFREEQSGRLMQRLYEIEAYRMMALLALPIARRMTRDLDDIDTTLQTLMRRMEAAEPSRSGGHDASILEELTHLAVRIESLASHGSRFSASRAYERLVLSRIQELREQRIDGIPTIAEFMERRFAPAMQTCRSIWSRHEQTALRVARAVDLLRTRVNHAQEQDVTHLLAGMERTARNQLHLQHAVEGLSVAAISYYVLSLTGAALRALHDLSLPISPDLAEGLLIVPIVFLVVRITRRTKHRIADKDHEHCSRDRFASGNLR